MEAKIEKKHEQNFSFTSKMLDISAMKVPEDIKYFRSEHIDWTYKGKLPKSISEYLKLN